MSIPAVVIGASGYVGGELLRLVASHPEFELAAAVSSSRAGEPIANTFGHLAPVLGKETFAEADSWLDPVSASGKRVAVFSAAPHGASAAMLGELIDKAKRQNIDLHIVDASADFRFSKQAAYESVYGEHGAPELLDSFSSGLPEHVPSIHTPHIGNPGCFATAMLLAIVPLHNAGLATGRFTASGITGSTGSGRAPGAGTHHPERHSNLYAYKPLAHRHAPEVIHLAGLATDSEPELAFIPHSGPFARGIHMTVFADASEHISESAVLDHLREAYADAPFVNVIDGMPKLKDVVASNHALLGAATNGRQIAVTCVIDNLVKGAAGGAVQWMNRLFELPQTAGLEAPAPAWT